MERRSPKTTSLGLTFPLLAVALAAACNQDSAYEGGDLTITVDTIDGVVRVTNHGTPPEWRLTPIVSIGPKSLAVGAGSPEEFGAVTSASLGPDEAVFVADALNRGNPGLRPRRGPSSHFRSGRRGSRRVQQPVFRGVDRGSASDSGSCPGPRRRILSPGASGSASGKLREESPAPVFV